MSDQATQPIDSSAQLPPPIGNFEQADKYITQLVKLISEDKLLVSHTDLSRFDPTSLQDHYRLDLKDYEIEVSHSKQPDTGLDSFVILFNNLRHLNGQTSTKVILAYVHLNETQFKKFKTICDDQMLRKKKEADEKKFRETMKPIDLALEQLSTNSAEKTNSANDVNESDTSRLIADGIPPVLDNTSIPLVASV